MHSIAIVIVAITSINIIILFHEYAHALVASAFKLPIEVIKIGFGPSIWQRKFRDTKIQLGIIPLGGFTKINDVYFEATPPFKKILIWLAGPLSHLILAIIFIFFAFIIKVPYFPLEIIEIDEASINPPAKVINIKNQLSNRPLDYYAAVFSINHAPVVLYTHYGNITVNIANKTLSAQDLYHNTVYGIKFSVPEKKYFLNNPPGEIISINGNSLSNNEMQTLLKGLIGKKVAVSFVTEGKVATKLIPVSYYWGPTWNITPTLEANITTSYLNNPAHYPENLRLKIVLRQVMQLLNYQVGLLYAICTGKVDWHILMGPAGFFHNFMMVLNSNISGIILFGLGSLNVWLFLFNLLPIPPLDGGRLVLDLFRTPKRYVLLFNQLGLITLVTLIAVLSINEVMHILSQWQNAYPI